MANLDTDKIFWHGPPRIAITRDVMRSFKAITIWQIVSIFGIIFITSGDFVNAEFGVGSKEEMGAVFVVSSNSGKGTGFACVYKDREFVATNLHVLAGAEPILVKSQNGEAITLSGQMMAAEDADICLLGIKGSFSDSKIVPLKFIENVFDESKVGDSVNCLGNSLGNGVVLVTKGAIKAYGQPRLEIDSPFVKGNSGGPVVHRLTGRVVGIVTEAVINSLTFDALGVAASNSKKSEVSMISYFAHRIDTVKQWTGSSLASYLKTGELMDHAASGLKKTTLFITNKNDKNDGWEKDARLIANWNEYQKFLSNAKDKSKKSVKVTEYVNEFGVMVRRDVRVRSMSISEGDYIQARKRFLRGIEWKILADQQTLKNVKPIGYIQSNQRSDALAFSVQVISLSKNL